MEEKERIPFSPKNVRQIGEIEGNYRVYMEDYVITLLNQMADKELVGSRAVLLLGEHYRADDIVYYFVYGAISGKRDRLEEGLPIFEEEERQYLLSQKERYFSKLHILGWAVLESPFNTITNETLWKDMGQDFSKEEKIFLRLEKEEKLSQITICRQNLFHAISGYQIFYDANEDMQAYLINWHEKQEKKPVENVRDMATRQFRNAIQGKREIHQQKRSADFFYVATCMLLILMCVTGITMLNNYQKLKKVEMAMNHLMQTIEEQKEILAYNEEEATVLNGVQEKRQEDKLINEDIIIEEMQSMETEEVMVEEQSTEQAIAEANTSDVATTYIVKKGDTLLTISQEFYKTKGKVKEICAMNHIQNPDNITEGQKILLP